MNKIVLICCLLFVFAIQNANSRPVDAEKAKQVALNWLFEKSGRKLDPSSKSGRKLDTPTITTAFTRKVDSENIYYVLNYPQGGWVIISADDIANPIIAFSYTGTYSSQGHPIQFDQWMDNVTTQIHTAKDKQNEPSPKAKKEWDRLNVIPAEFTAHPLSSSAISPLLTTTWNQGRYYNTSCPEDSSGADGHVWAGCVATAMGQVMKYHNHPSIGAGSHSYDDNSYGIQSADFGMTTYNWSSMPDSLRDYNVDVATMLYHAGVSVEMDYGTSGSSANVGIDATNALKTYFKYSYSLYYAEKSDYSIDEWVALLHTELNNSRPVIYRGSGTGGHAFVCDGYMGSADDFFHFNWGWGGYLDGYFYLHDLTPGSHSYTNSQGALIGVTPVGDPHLSYPYHESFEEGTPENWAMAGSLVGIITDDFHCGANSLGLSGPDIRGSWSNRNNSAILDINVPVEGAQLSFWVKRGYDPAASPYSQQTASLKTQFGDTTLYTFYDGDFNDSQWQQFSLDLLPYAGSNIKLVVTQYHNSSNYYQWTYLDDVEITLPPTLCFEDLDQDGYGSGNIIEDDGNDVCETEAGESTISSDCNDTDPSVHPGAPEIAGDGVDQDCNSQEICYADLDDDGYRPNALSTVNSADSDCTDSTEATFSDPTTDCNDTDPSVHPGAPEITGDGVDQDCNNQEICYADLDDDGYRPNALSTVNSADSDCTDSTEATSSDPTTDCNDTDPSVHPGAPEIAGDGVDQDCNGQEICYADLDDDGYRPDALSTVNSADSDCTDSTEATFSDPTTDCNDTDPSVHPGAPEIAGDGVDQDCNSQEICYADLDDDGYGSNSAVIDDGDWVCNSIGESNISSDCNDADGSVHPDAIEVCDSKDNNCDCQIDENGVCNNSFWNLMLPTIVNGRR